MIKMNFGTEIVIMKQNQNLLYSIGRGVTLFSWRIIECFL